jgi:hypothetical protein
VSGAKSRDGSWLAALIPISVFTLVVFMMAKRVKMTKARDESARVHFAGDDTNSPKLRPKRSKKKKNRKKPRSRFHQNEAS